MMNHDPFMIPRTIPLPPGKGDLFGTIATVEATASPATLAVPLVAGNVD